MVVRMLHGSGEQRILQLGLDKFPTYGAMRDVDRRQIRAYIDHLMGEGYLTLSGDEYPVLRLCERAGEVLFNGGQVIITERVAHKEEKKRGKKAKEKAAQNADNTLLEALKALRTKLAQKENVPAYIVFSNAALSDMAAKQPTTMEAFLQVSGVGEVKAARYGKAFLKAIREWEDERE